MHTEQQQQKCKLMLSFTLLNFLLNMLLCIYLLLGLKVTNARLGLSYTTTLVVWTRVVMLPQQLHPMTSSM